ncbi:MAG: sensor histidine kinase [Actinomycetota bacterium]
MSDVRFAELIGKIAHELRSPLTSVKGFSATLMKRWDRFTDEQRLQFVQTIHADAERMGRIVSEVLDLARLETGRLELNLATLDLAGVMEKAASNVAGLAGAERVTIDVEPGLVAWADADRLEHVLTNLVENAIKFSDSGAITVSGRSVDGWVELSVTDEGIGIEEDRIADLFSGPAPAGQRTGPSGSGLGLYLTRLLVEAHGGTIAVSSEPGGGSTFTARIPQERVG